MNPDFRKVALIAASLGLLVSLFFALRPDDEPASTTAAPPATTDRTPATTRRRRRHDDRATRTAPSPCRAEPDVVTVRIAVP